jgi:predicted nucleic acid-binding protein
MNGKVFLDTNIFVYMQSSREPVKKEVSLQVLDTFECVASTQVLNELCNVLFKKFAMSANDIEQVIDAVDDTCEVDVVTAETVKVAIDLKSRYGYSYYDCLIIASALEYECDYIFSEDMSDGQIIENRLEIVNIFTRPDILRNNS